MLFSFWWGARVISWCVFYNFIVLTFVICVIFVNVEKKLDVALEKNEPV